MSDVLLAIDASTGVSSVALYDGDVVAEHTWRGAQSQSRDLLPSVDHLLGRSSITLDAVTAVAVGLGPGSFNGLRVGIATAKMLAIGRSVPILGAGTLDAAAAAFRHYQYPVRPLLAGGRGQVATALYTPAPHRRRVEEPHLALLAELLAADDGPVVYCGDLTPEWIEMIAQRGADAIVPDPPARLRRASLVALLAWERLAQGERDDVASLQPIYLRRPDITVRRR